MMMEHWDSFGTVFPGSERGCDKVLPCWAREEGLESCMTLKELWGLDGKGLKGLGHRLVRVVLSLL